MRAGRRPQPGDEALLKRLELQGHEHTTEAVLARDPVRQRQQLTLEPTQAIGLRRIYL